jgi:hypothetical protein
LKTPNFGHEHCVWVGKAREKAMIGKVSLVNIQDTHSTLTTHTRGQRERERTAVSTYNGIRQFCPTNPRVRPHRQSRAATFPGQSFWVGNHEFGRQTDRRTRAVPIFQVGGGYVSSDREGKDGLRTHTYTNTRERESQAEIPMNSPSTCKPSQLHRDDVGNSCQSPHHHPSSY